MHLPKIYTRNCLTMILASSKPTFILSKHYKNPSQDLSMSTSEIKTLTFLTRVFKTCRIFQYTWKKNKNAYYEVGTHLFSSTACHLWHFSLLLPEVRSKLLHLFKPKYYVTNFWMPDSTRPFSKRHVDTLRRFAVSEKLHDFGNIKKQTVQTVQRFIKSNILNKHN